MSKTKVLRAEDVLNYFMGDNVGLARGAEHYHQAALPALEALPPKILAQFLDEDVPFDPAKFFGGWTAKSRSLFLATIAKFH